MASAHVDIQAFMNKLYSIIQPHISEITELYRSQISYQNELLQQAKMAIETPALFKVPGPRTRAPRTTRALRRRSSLHVSKDTVEETLPSIAPIEEEAKTVKQERSQSTEKSSPSSSEKENRVPGTNVPVTEQNGLDTVHEAPNSADEGTTNTDLPASSSVPDPNKSPNKIAAKTPRQARERLRHVRVSAGKNTPVQKHALFSPYGKFSIREKAQAFEQRASPSPSRVIPENQQTPVVVLETELRESCKIHESTKLQSCHKGEELPTPDQLVQGSKEEASALQNDGDVMNKCTPEDCPPKGRKAAAKKEKKQKKPSPATTCVAPVKILSAKKFRNPLKKHARSSSSSFTVMPLVTPKVVSSSPAQGTKSAAGSYRLGMKRHPSGQLKQAPSDHVRKVSGGSQEREKERKLERMKLKAEETKKKRESRAARVRATKKQQEEKMMIEQQQREQREQQKEQERQKKRKAFHQRTQSEREREIAGCSNQVKRKGNSPADTTRKKIHLEPIRIKVTHQENTLAASHLVFFEPTTCLSNKVKLNNSLQQQAILNNMSMSLRSDQPDSSLHENATAEQPQPPLNATYVAEQKQDASTAAEDHPNQSGFCKTPKANGTFCVAKDASSYSITPHHSELPPAPNPDPDNYDIEDFKSGDETDDEDMPRKVVPLWARGHRLRKYIDRQFRTGWDNDDPFGELVDINLSTVFTGNWRHIKKRTSSAIWTSPIARPT